jgi:hypothetical protein
MQKNHPMGEEAHALEVGTCIEIARVRDAVRVVDTNAYDAAQLRQAVTDEVFFGGFGSTLSETSSSQLKSGSEILVPGKRAQETSHNTRSTKDQDQ